MKVADLFGAELDFWVARAEGISALICRDLCYAGISADYMRKPKAGWAPPFSPSISWEQSGPIIERERISIRYIRMYPGDKNPTPAATLACRTELTELRAGPAKGAGWYFGETPLIAAMRAYVASKFGDEVPEARETVRG